MSTVIQVIHGNVDTELRLVEFDHYLGGRARVWEVWLHGGRVAQLEPEQITEAAAIAAQPEIVAGSSSQAGLASFRTRR